MKISNLAENLVSSEIIKLAWELNKLKDTGKRIFNFTIGDFDSAIFPIPIQLKEEIKKAYDEGFTTYPPANGILPLRQSLSKFLKRKLDLSYSPDEILVAGGARPLVYSAFRALIDPGDKVVFPAPSWNNIHYCYLSKAVPVILETTAENGFMPTAAQFVPHIKEATMLALCSPLNPSGTIFTKENLIEICELVIAENKRRSTTEKPLYILFDQIYWTLIFKNNKHFNPVSLYPELRNYTVFIDGLSKSFSATGLRVGWAYGPSFIIDSMKSVLSHVGAWAPTAEQMATARFLNNPVIVDDGIVLINQKAIERLDALYVGFLKLKNDGFSIDVIEPKATIYLSVKFDLIGKMYNGSVIENINGIQEFLLNEIGLGVVPFYIFGNSRDLPWFRLSVGTTNLNEIEELFSILKSSLKKLK